MENLIGIEFKDQAIFRMGESRARILACLDQLSDEELWARPNTQSNSVGNLLLHLTGNITQWILTGLGGRIDGRDRDSEFRAAGGIPGAELRERITGTLDEAVRIIEAADADGLLRKRKVQGFEFSGVGIILHVVEHLSYHTGQIAFWTKSLKDMDLGFYRGVDLNKRSGMAGP